MAKGMWCSASRRMASSSSLGVALGNETRLTIESRPETEITAAVLVIPALPRHSLMASLTIAG